MLANGHNKKKHVFFNCLKRNAKITFMSKAAAKQCPFYRIFKIRCTRIILTLTNTEYSAITVPTFTVK